MRRATARRCRALVVLAVMIIPATAFGQSIRADPGLGVNSPHRPWVGVSLGTGFLGGDHVEPDDSRDLGISLDMPIQPIARIRVGAGRMRVNGASFGEFPLRRVTIDAVALMPFPRGRRACQSHFVVGGGIGAYHFGLGNDFSETRRGYQIFAGGECVGRRLSFDLGITGRSIRGPANVRLPDDRVFALDMHFGLKLRL
jgi:hypothetical protein